MSDNIIERSICQAIEIIANQKVAQANFDKTKKVTIAKVLDATIGKYLVKYQDSTFTAWSIGNNIDYAVGDLVLLLSPNGKTDGTQVIIGSASPTPRQYSIKKSNKIDYNILGTNAVSMNERIGISSYDNITLPKVLYNSQQDENIIDIDQDSLKRYIQEGNAAVVSCVFQTDLDMTQVSGIYGIQIDYVQGRTVKEQEEEISIDNIKTLFLNSTLLQGYPYGKTQPTRVIVPMLDIQPYGFKEIKEIRAVAIDFNKNDLGEENNPDIFISDITISGAQIYNIEQEGNYLLNIDYSTDGNRLYQNEENQEDSKKSILLKAQIKIDGNQMTSIDGVQYYWFRQNASVTLGNPSYHPKAGAGWQAITGFQGSENNRHPSFSNKNTYIISDSQDKFDKQGNQFDYQAKATQKKNKYKCFAHFDNLWLQGQVIVYNDNLDVDIEIVSSDTLANGENRTQYRMGYGSPTFTCKVSEEETDDIKFTYTWLVSSNGVPATTVKKDDFSDSERNLYKDFPIKSINKKATISCAVNKVKIAQEEDGKNQVTYLGTDSITLTNVNQLAETYELIIQNGTQVFKYDNNGISPASEALQEPLEIKPLSFVFSDPDGMEIPYDVLQSSGAIIEWYVPKEDSGTLLRCDSPVSRTAADFNVYQNSGFLSFSIADTYNGESYLNYIRLHVHYKDMDFNAYTNFTFAKDGDPGTNGTSYLAKITPEDEEWAASDRIYGVRIRIGQSPNYNYYFKEFFNEVGTSTTNALKLKNKVYYNSKELESDISTAWSCPIKKNEVAWIQCDAGIIRSSSSVGYPSNIIRATSQINQDMIIYSEYPVYFNYIYEKGLKPGEDTSILPSERTPLYRFKLKQKSGFKYVKYSEDGTFPSYNQNPFEVIVEKQIDDTYTKIDSNQFKCNWSVLGNLKQPQLSNESINTIEPQDTYSGQKIDSAIKIQITIIKDEDIGENITVGYLHIPIYMYINRYNHRALNDWDGNSINLDKDNNQTILAPQIGAGKKNTDNSFTGIFMGQVLTHPTLEEEQSTTETGLFGYNSGQRSIFLDAETGKAEFGTNNSGKLIIDPTDSTAKIQSNNYNYNPTSTKGSGMMIDFTTPQILFGSGNFEVDSGGNLIAKGGGSIGGWKIKDHTLQSNNGHIVLDATGNTAIKGTNGTNTVFSVSKDGYLTSTSGKIGGWTINSNSLSNAGSAGTVTLSTGATAINASNKFLVSANGKMTATDADISGKIVAKSGTVGGWTINDSTITSGKLKLDSKGTITGGNSSTTGWGINANGSAYFNNASIGGILVDSNGMSGPGWYIKPGQAHFTGLQINLANGQVSVGTGGGSGGISGGGAAWTPSGVSLNPNYTSVGDQKIPDYTSNITKRRVQQGNFTVSNRAVTWRTYQVVSNVQLKNNKLHITYSKMLVLGAQEQSGGSKDIDQ